MATMMSLYFILNVVVINGITWDPGNDNYQIQVRKSVEEWHSNLPVACSQMWSYLCQSEVSTFITHDLHDNIYHRPFKRNCIEPVYKSSGQFFFFNWYLIINNILLEDLFVKYHVVYLYLRYYVTVNDAQSLEPHNW